VRITDLERQIAADPRHPCSQTLRENIQLREQVVKLKEKLAFALRLLEV
jgi:hypothetical protein